MSATLLPDSDYRPQANDTGTAPLVEVRTLSRDDDGAASDSDSITLNGVTYKIDRLISASTGEAEIFQLSKDGSIYALKLYYGLYAPDLEVVATLKEAAGTGVLVDILDYGTTMRRGEERFYELMPFYTGGELKPGSMRGNPDRLKVTALAMMMALKTAHNHHILHKDIKPGNFFYTDDSCNQLVLADFGIAQKFGYNGDKFEIISHSQTRTVIYAAPEMYANTIQNSRGELEIKYFDDKSDYFSLGVSLLTLWSGEEPLKMGEFDLNGLKRRETGTLPIPDDMPPDIARLINGLTTPNPLKRWAFDEFSRWLHGVQVPVDGENERAGASALNINYNGSKGWTATSLEELAEMMLADRKLAANYLYSGKISGWLGQAGYPEMVAQIDEFVKKIYPTNQTAGVTAVTYLLDPTLPYISPTGKTLRTQQEIAADIVLDNRPYVQEITQPDSSLYIYFNALGAPNFADRFVPLAKAHTIKAIWQFIFTLDPSQEFPILDASHSSYGVANTVEELLDKFAELPPYSWDDDTTGYVSLLTDEAFILWLSYRDEALAGKIKSKLAPYANAAAKPRQLYYYVLYLLDPSRPFQLEASAIAKNTTAKELAWTINNDYLCFHVAGRFEKPDSEFLNLPDQLMKCQDNRLYFYLKAKEVYQEKIDYIRYAFDFTLKEHRNSTGPYNKDIAFFKAVKALAGVAHYAFFIDGNWKLVTDLEGLNEIPIEYQLEELKNGKLKEWLAVQYQEDPFADLSKKYTYENLLSDYTWKLYDINNDEAVAERYNDAAMEIINREDRIKKRLRVNYFWRAVFGVIVALPLLALGTFAAVFGCASFANPSPVWSYLIAAVPLTVAFRVIQLFPKVDKWLLQPFGRRLFQPLLMHRWIVSAIYAFTFCILCWVLENFGAGITGRILIPLLCLAVLVWRYTLTIGNYPLMQNVYQDAIHPGEVAIKIEPLYWAWHGFAEGPFDSQTRDRQEVYYAGIGAARNFCVYRTFFSLFAVAALLALYIPFCPLTENYIKNTDPQKWEQVYGDRSDVTAVEEVLATRWYADVNSSLTVRTAPDASAPKIGSLAKGEEMDVISIEGKFAKIKYGDGVAYVNASYIKPVEK